MTATLTGTQIALALEGDQGATSASRVLLVVGGIVYMAWWPLMRWIAPEAYDPLVGRLAIGLLCLGLVAASFLRGMRSRLDLFTGIVIFLGTGHLMLLAGRNDLTGLYLMATFIAVGALGPTFVELRAAVIYSVFATAAAALAAAIANAPLPTKLGFVAGVVSLLGLMAVGLWRGRAIRRASHHNLREASRFFRNLVDVLPDPIYARSTDGSWEVSNEAFERQLRGDQDTTEDSMNLAQREVLAALERSESLALATGHVIERDINFFDDAGGQRVVSLKVAAPQMRDGQRVIIGLVREVTERRRLEESLRAKVTELETARNEVKHLRGLLPICMHCGRIRRKSGSWDMLESFIQEHSEATFTHGVCDRCLDEQYPGG